MTPANDTIETLRAEVRARYGAAATAVADGGDASCCGTSCCGDAATLGVDVNVITADLYSDAEKAGVPAEALLASLGCGNPTALAALRPGERVLDLGSGGGIDVLLSARRVGPTGKAYGLDMTDEMLALAERNAAAAGVTNVQFLRGEIERIPLPANSVDVIISNCVINLSGDERAVIREAFRVLAPGGRFAVTDVVSRGAVPPEVQRNMALWVGCIAGALADDEFRALLAEAGFTEIEIEPVRVYTAEDAKAFFAAAGLDADRLAAEVGDRFLSAFVRATKPAARPLPLAEPAAEAAPCCPPGCC